MEAISPNDVAGAFFGIMCGILIQQGFDTEEKIRCELERGLHFVVKSGKLNI